MKLEHADLIARAIVDKLRAPMGEVVNEGEVIKILFPKYAHGGAGNTLDFSAYTHKVCSKCKQILPVDKFAREARGFGWRFRSQCKDCKRPYNAAYATKRRRLAGVVERKRRTREDAMTAQRLASRRYYARHQKQEQQRTKSWRMANPQKQRFMEKRRRARIAGAAGSHTLAEWMKVKQEFGNMCVLCQRADMKLTQDHATPLVIGGTDFIENILPLCHSCNSSKQNKVLDPLDVEWMRFRYKSVAGEQQYMELSK